MEIIVVIIVISTLASVAGPAISAITDEGRISATQRQMANLKQAILSYRSDVGRYPHAGNAFTRQNIAAGDLTALGEGLSNNVLISNTVMTHGLSADIYGRRWKGPYMDADPSDFMVDPWSNKIKLVCLKKRLFLQSYGPDAQPDTTNMANFLNGTYSGDDVFLMVTKISRFDNFITNPFDLLDAEL